MRCGPCEEHFQTMDAELVKDLELLEFTVTRIAEQVSEKVGPHLFTVAKLAANDEVIEAEPADIPLELQRFRQFSALIYAAAYMAAQYSPSTRSDEMLHYITVNAINDGNAVACGKDNNHAH